MGSASKQLDFLASQVELVVKNLPAQMKET